jgi:predicted Fe-Mo cluster-binding NifX family protein
MVKHPMRLAVAEETQENRLAPRLGRAVKFALFDVHGQEIRGPFYRVRHDDPGQVCDQHAELAALLHDCKLVIAGSVGPRMAQQLRARGIDVLATAENRPTAELVSRWVSGTLVAETP